MTGSEENGSTTRHGNSVKSRKKICICVLCGLPGAGKTTLASRLFQLCKSEFDINTVSYDNLIDPNSDLTLLSWKKHRDDLLDKLRGQIEFDLENASSVGKASVFIIDDNMFLKSMRYSCYQLARTLSLGFCQIYLCTDRQACLHRVSLRNSTGAAKYIISDSTFQNIADKFEAPNQLKNSWERDTIVLNFNDDFDSTELYKIIELFRKAVDSPVPQLVFKGPKQVCGVESFYHQADLLLRTIVKQKITNCEAASCQKFAKKLSEKKKFFITLLQQPTFAEVNICLSSYDENVRSSILELLSTLDWPLHKWEPEELCAQIVEQCFDYFITQDSGV